jgi:hypothetical protein
MSKVLRTVHAASRRVHGLAGFFVTIARPERFELPTLRFEA